MDGTVTVCGCAYRIVRLLGHGKGGYSYLAEADGQAVVLKQIHHEPCSYYTFGNKIEAECRDYERLQNAGIRIAVIVHVYDLVVVGKHAKFIRRWIAHRANREVECRSGAIVHRSSCGNLTKIWVWA